MLISALAGFVVASAHIQSPKVRFVVAGDDRVEMSPNGADRATDNYTTGINEGVVGPMWDAIFKEPGLNFVVFTGDLVSGETSPTAPANRRVSGKLEEQLKGWTTLLMAHQTNPPTPVYPVRGNHEINIQNGRTRADANKAWSDFFADLMTQQHVVNPPSNPFNFTIRDYPGVMMLGLDTFQDKLEYTVDNAWVKSELATAPKYVFPYLHSMCFYAGNHKDYVGGKPPVVSEADAKKNRNEFMDMLKGVNCQYLFAGHDHFLTVVDATQPAWGNYSIRQIVGGTAGAPFVSVKTIPPTEDIYSITHPITMQNMFGYVLVDIDGDKVTVTFKSIPTGTGTPNKVDLTRRS